MSWKILDGWRVRLMPNLVTCLRFGGVLILLFKGYEVAEDTSSCICGLEVQGRHIRNGRNPGGRP
jgi:hypothetical protein